MQVDSNATPTKSRRTWLTGAAAAAVMMMSGQVMAQAYPTKFITMVVPYPPGGATDVIGRVLAQKLSTELGKQVMVENRAGAAGNIGAAVVANAAPDGYTLLMGAMTSHSISAALNPKIARFDMEKSFVPIAIVGHVPLVFTVNPKIKASNLNQLIALAKAKPGGITFASAGNGSPQHLAGEVFQRVAGVKMLHVPYKGSGPAMTDLIGGQVDSMIETAPAAQSHIKAGKLRALAVASANHVPTLPNVPTATEEGLKGFEVTSMFGVAAPAKTPAPVVARLNAALKKILSDPAVKSALLAQGAMATWTTPEDAAKALRAESAKWNKVIVEGNIKPE